MSSYVKFKTVSEPFRSSKVSRIDSPTISTPKRARTSSKRRVNRKCRVISILALRPVLEEFEMIWAHIRGYANWPGIIEKKLSNGKYLVHFFGDYTRSAVTKNKIMNFFEGFQNYVNVVRPTACLMKAIRETQIVMLDIDRKECAICKMLEFKNKMSENVQLMSIRKH